MSTLTKQQLDELQALLDAAPKPASDWFPLFQRGVQWETAKLWVSLHNSAPALLQAARDNFKLKEERENWRLSSVCREKQVKLEELQEQNAKLREALIDMTAIARIKWGNTDSSVNEIMDRADKALNQGKEPA